MPNAVFTAVSKRQVQAVVNNMHASGYAHNTIAVAIMYWNALINYCTDNKLSAGPKADKIKPKLTRFRIINDQEEAAMLAATCPTATYPGKNALSDAQRQDNQDVLVCLLHLGARINEAQNLRWSDIDFTANTVLVRRLKRSNDTLLLMTNALRLMMERRHKARTDAWVFPSKAGTYKTNAQWVNTIVKRAGIDLESGKITSHTFRHTAATRLLRAGSTRPASFCLFWQQADFRPNTAIFRQNIFDQQRGNLADTHPGQVGHQQHCSISGCMPFNCNERKDALKFFFGECFCLCHIENKRI